MLTVRYARKMPTPYERWLQENRRWASVMIPLAIVLLVLSWLAMPSASQPGKWFIASLPEGSAPVYQVAASKEDCIASASADPTVVCLSGNGLVPVETSEDSR